MAAIPADGQSRAGGVLRLGREGSSGTPVPGLLGFIRGETPSHCMDVNPDIVAAVAIEAWLMARTQALRMGPPTMTQDAATKQAIEELKDRYPAMGGALRRLTVANTFGTTRRKPAEQAPHNAST